MAPCHSPGHWEGRSWFVGAALTGSVRLALESDRVFWKIIAIPCLLLLPLSAMLWHTSCTAPQHRRYDVTLYKSLRIVLRDGVCALDLLAMPTKTASRTHFESPLRAGPAPGPSWISFQTRKHGPYRTTSVAFPLWMSTVTLLVAGVFPLAIGPVRTWRRLRNGWCLSCGYDLRGTRSGRCSECGVRFKRSPTWSRLDKRF